MPLPIFVPPGGPSAAHHSAVDIAAFGRDAPGCGSQSASSAIGPTPHRAATHQNMTFAGRADRTADKIDECIAGCFCCCIGTRMTGSAGAIHFAGGMPDSLILGPSAHQIGPSPSQTLIGVQVNVSPLGTMATFKAKSRSRLNIIQTTCDSPKNMSSDGSAHFVV